MNSPENWDDAQLSGEFFHCFPVCQVHLSGSPEYPPENGAFRRFHSVDFFL
jgi:hypothetical protein